MVRDFNFSRIPEIYFGAGKFDLLPDLVRRFGTSALILTGGRSFSESPYSVKMEKGLTDKGITYNVVRISSEPSTYLIDGIVNDQFKSDLDVVVAIGGGSVIDTGKAVSAMLTQDSLVIEYLEGVGTGRDHPGKKVPFIAVPTTSGTGSESTKNAVLSNPGPEGFKRSLRHENFIPNIALVDPELTHSCPKEITAACGMDAFTQLLESFVSVKASVFTDSLAYRGLAIAAAALPAAYANPGDIDARAGMSYASLISGITLANAGLGIVHGFASAIGGYHDIPHGVVCGTLVAGCTKMNIFELMKNDPGNPAIAKYARIGRIFSKTDTNDDMNNCKVLIDHLESWAAKFSIPTLGTYGIIENDIPAIINATGLKENPVALEKKQMSKILMDRI